MTKKFLTAVILAGGLGTRLKPFTEIIPKPLLPIGEKSVLEIQISKLRGNGFRNIFLATNYMSDYIENFFGDGSRYGVNLFVSKEDFPLGTVGPLTLLKDKLQEPFLVMNGDILTNVNFEDLYNKALSFSSLLTICIKEYETPFRFGNIFYEGDFVTRMEEKTGFKTNILAGVYIFKPEIFSLIPDNQYFGMDTLINKMLEQNLKISKYEIHDYWLDIGQLDDYEEAQKSFKSIDGV